MESNPAGGDVIARRVDLTQAVAFDLADLDEATILDGDVGEDPGIAAAVDDAAVANDEVVHRRRCAPRPRPRGHRQRGDRDCRGNGPQRHHFDFNRLEQQVLVVVAEVGERAIPLSW